jgi:hypothetical protein
LKLLVKKLEDLHGELFWLLSSWQKRKRGKKVAAKVVLKRLCAGLSKGPTKGGRHRKSPRKGSFRRAAAQDRVRREARRVETQGILFFEVCAGFRFVFGLGSKESCFEESFFVGWRTGGCQSFRGP